MIIADFSNMASGNYFNNWNRLNRILFDKYSVLRILCLMQVKAPFVLRKLYSPNPLPPEIKDYK